MSLDQVCRTIYGKSVKLDGTIEVATFEMLREEIKKLSIEEAQNRCEFILIPLFKLLPVNVDLIAKVSSLTLEQVCKCLVVLVERCGQLHFVRRKDLFHPLFVRCLGVLTSPSNGKYVSDTVQEETKVSVFTLLTRLLSTEPLQTLPILVQERDACGHCILLLLDAGVTDKSKRVRVCALQALNGLLCSLKFEILWAIAPGTVTRLCELTNADYKVGSQVISAAYKALETLLLSIMSDALHSLELKEQNTLRALESLLGDGPAASKNVQEPPPLVPVEELKQVSKRLHDILMKMAIGKAGDTVQVTSVIMESRLGLFKNLFLHCNQTLELYDEDLGKNYSINLKLKSTIGFLLNEIIVEATNEVDSVSALAKSQFQEIVSLLKEKKHENALKVFLEKSFRFTLLKLYDVMRTSQSDLPFQRQCDYLRFLIDYLGPGSVEASLTQILDLKRVLNVFIQLLKLDTNNNNKRGVSVISIVNLSETRESESGEIKNHAGYEFYSLEWFPLKTEKPFQSLVKLVRLLSLVCFHPFMEVLMDLFNTKLGQSSNEKPQQKQQSNDVWHVGEENHASCVLLMYLLLSREGIEERTASAVLYCVVDVILPICRAGGGGGGANELNDYCYLGCLLCLGECARILKRGFRLKLVDALFPILEGLGRSNPLVSQVANKVLASMAKACEYEGGVDELFQSNVDYVISCLIDKLPFISHLDEDVAVIVEMLLMRVNAIHLKLFARDFLLASMQSLNSKRNVEGEVYCLLKILAITLPKLKSSISNNDEYGANHKKLRGNENLRHEEEINRFLGEISLSRMHEGDTIDEGEEEELEKREEENPESDSQLTEVILLHKVVNFVFDPEPLIRTQATRVVGEALLLLDDYVQKQAVLLNVKVIIHEVWPILIGQLESEYNSVLLDVLINVILSITNRDDFMTQRVNEDLLPVLLRYLDLYKNDETILPGLLGKLLWILQYCPQHLKTNSLVRKICIKLLPHLHSSSSSKNNNDIQNLVKVIFRQLIFNQMGDVVFLFLDKMQNELFSLELKELLEME